jgi:hypothetical protein
VSIKEKKLLKKTTKPKILILDIETSPILAEVWGLRDQNIGLDQIVEDSSILAWAAKWYKEKKIFYKDTGDQKNKRDDSKILPTLWQLMNEADIVVGQNSQRFDVKIIESRFLYNNIKKRHLPSPFQQSDTLIMSKRFRLTSHKLEFMAKFFKLKNQKFVKREFYGHRLWSECLKNNKKAWAEMRKYNPQDIITTEELFDVLLPHNKKINFSVYNPLNEQKCSCGSFDLRPNGRDYQKTGVFRRYKCNECGKPFTDKSENLLSKPKRQGMLK